MSLEGGVEICVLRCGGELFGFETPEVQEVLGDCRIHPVPLAPRSIAGIVPYRGDVLTAVSLRNLIALPEHGTGTLLVFADVCPGERFGVLVDAVEGVIPLSRSQLHGNPATLDVRRKRLLNGTYTWQSQLIGRLDPRRLCPEELARNENWRGADDESADCG